MKQYKITKAYDKQNKLLCLTSFEIASQYELYDADKIVKDLIGREESTNTTIVGEKTRCVSGDGWVVIVEQI